jgi:methionine-R-sulfoxide reductase
MRQHQAQRKLRSFRARRTLLSMSGEISSVRPDGTPYPVQLDDVELRGRVDQLSYDVLRRAGTERPGSGEYTDTEAVGVYRCKACDAELFRSETKFHSGCGWPSFYEPTDSDAVVLLEDHLLGYPRVEARCANCGSHLGHVFRGEGFRVPTDERWCINSVSLTLEPRNT